MQRPVALQTASSSATRPDASRFTWVPLGSDGELLQETKCFGSFNLPGTPACALTTVVATSLAVRSRRRRKVARASSQRVPPVLSETSGKKYLKGAISWTLHTKGAARTKQLLDDMKVLGFGWATRAGISLGVDDMNTPAKKAPLCDGAQKRSQEAQERYQNGDITIVEKFLGVTGEWTKTSDEVKTAAIENFQKNDPNNPVYMMSTSGARGNISQVRQLLAMRGLMADANGQLIDVPIQHCLREGMTVTDMLISGNGARKGVIDTALRTADSGYLYRRLDFAASSVVVRSVDCGTTSSMSVKLPSSSNEATMFDRISGRVLAKDVLHPETQELLHHKGHLIRPWEADKIQDLWRQTAKDGDYPVGPVYVRSPMMCKARRGICSICYGEDLSTPGKLAQIGHPSGTIAAQSMGEPGTQLTMRTFHTGGAFEGSAGKGVQATGKGEVQLSTKSGQVISKALREDSTNPAASLITQWKRSPQGDIGCILSEAATLRVMNDTEVVQEEEIEPGSFIKALDGADVLMGQVLFEEPISATQELKEENLETIAKPIQAETSGEVIVEEIPSEAACIEGSAKLIWVLQGSCTTFQQSTGCSLTVKTGDMVTEGTAVAQEWARTSRIGVPRFQPPSRSSARKDEEFNKMCLRTDFDWFFFGGQSRATEYKASFVVPASLGGTTDSQKSSDAQRDKFYQKNRIRASKLRGDEVKAADPVSVFAQYSEPTKSSSSRSTVGKVSVMCAPPDRSRGAVIYPVSRSVKPEYIVPTGGLLVHVDGGKGLLWAPEDVLKFPVVAGKAHMKDLEDRYGKEMSCPFGCRRPAFFAVHRQETSKELIQEDDGAMVLKCWDRVYVDRGLQPDELENAPHQGGHFGCAVKPGKVIFAPSEYFKDGTWCAAAEVEVGEGGFHIFQKIIPPGKPLIAALPNSRNGDSWRIVELLDNPQTHKTVRVLLRHTSYIPLESPDIALPSQTRTMTFGAPAHESGTVVTANSRVAVAYEVLASVSRHPSEEHCTTVAPSGPPDSSPKLPVMVEDGGMTLEATRQWEPGDLCGIQHSPLGPARSVGGGAGWRDAEPRHLMPESEMAVPKRDRATVTGGLICTAKTEVVQYTASSRTVDGETADTTAEAGVKRANVVSIAEDDVARVTCRSRPSVSVGDLVHVQEKLSAEDVSPCAGQVLSIEVAGSSDPEGFIVTVRRGRCYLVTSRGRVDVQTGDIVEQGDVVGSEDLIAPRTSDIVQGLPRIDKLFEAANTTLQDQLNERWEQERLTHTDFEAACIARDAMRKVVVAEVQGTYQEQGVSINSKHIEVVVGRMTQTCMILEGVGSLQAGTEANYDEIEALHALQPSAQVRARPLIHGITAVGIGGSHLLVAMGFREVDNVLAKSVLTGPVRHSMEGVKENLMAGKACTIGTNAKKADDSDAASGIDFDLIPEADDSDAASGIDFDLIPEALMPDGSSAQFEDV